MRKRKKQNRFNAFVIRKTDISFGIVIAAVLGLICIAFTSKFSFSDYQLKEFLNIWMPVISNPADKLRHTAEKIISVVNSKSVLAQTLPMLSIDISNVTIDEQASENAEKAPEPLPPEPQIPPNTFPIESLHVESKNLEVRNETTYQPDFNSLLYAPLSFSSPEILIVHTHASESYKNDTLNYYTEGDADRTTDTNFNVVRVGHELAEELKGYGFKVTHARDINDYPSYNKSYNKTLEVINYYLRENKNIRIVLDIHRDAVVRDDGTKIKFSSGSNTENAAQVMIVCGTNQAGLENDTWQENLKLALKMQNYMEVNYPGFARPLNLRQERFNTHATPGSMIIEIGASGNTLDEALASVKYLAKTIKEVLKPYG